jgi:hypothetical protein
LSTFSARSDPPGRRWPLISRLRLELDDVELEFDLGTGHAWYAIWFTSSPVQPRRKGSSAAKAMIS